jgi:hypothetical protein
MIIKTTQKKTIQEDVEIEIVKHTHVPYWAFAGHPCCKCKWPIGGDQLHPDTDDCVVGLSKDGLRYFFHAGCFAG